MHVSSAYALVSRLARVYFPFCLCLAFADVRSGHLMEDRPPLASHTLTAKDHENEQFYNTESPIEAVKNRPRILTPA